MSSNATAFYKAIHSRKSYTKLYWDVANKIGIHEALLIEIVERWCELNEEKEKRGYFHEGEWWTAATYKEWAEKYPKLGSWKSLQRMFLGLEKAGYILSGKFTKGSQCKYYRVNPELIGELLLTGTLKSQTGIVSKTDYGVSKCDYGVSDCDYGVSDCDYPLYIDQIIKKDHLIISPTPLGENPEDDDDSSSPNFQDKDNPSTPLATSKDLKQVSPGRDNNNSDNGKGREATLTARTGVPEVRTTQRTLQPLKENFFGEDKPWSILAVEVGTTPAEIHSLAQRWLAHGSRDKKDPQAYVATILSKLAQDPNSRHNSMLWRRFEDAVLAHGVEKLAAEQEAKEANRPPDTSQGFREHPRFDEWMEVLKPGKVGLKKFAEQGEADGSEGVRRDFYKWAKSENLFTFNWG